MLGFQESERKDNKVMEHYIVYWPQDVVNALKNAKDEGPIKVVYGSIHSRMPSIASVRKGDIIYPVSLIKNQFYVMARLPVEHKEQAFDYCMRELGTQYSALIPDGIVMECRDAGGRIYYWTGDCESYRDRESVPKGMQIISLSEQVEKPHQAHQEPFNCCSKHAAWGTGGSSICPRPLPAELVPELRFGPKGKERPLTFRRDGTVLPSSLTSTRRMTAETAEIFERLF